MPGDLAPRCWLTRDRFSVVALLSLAVACASAPEPVPAIEPEPARIRAALASLDVINHSTEPLAILYRLTSLPMTGAATETTIGHVAPKAAAEMPPVPAGEPIILIARTAAGTELVLPARAFLLDAHWTWRIPANARFTVPSGQRVP